MWFTRDLRLDDQPALRLAAEADMLMCVFVVDPRWFRQTKWQSRPMGRHRWRFLWQSLHALDLALRGHGQRLHIAWGEPSATITTLAQRHGIHHVFVSRQPGTEEESERETVRQNLAGKAELHTLETLTALHQDDLPFPLNDLPPTFSQFRKKVESAGLGARPVQAPPVSLPPAPGFAEDGRDDLPATDPAASPLFQGGEQPAWDRLNHYLFQSHRVATYKQTRNALDETDASSRLSPWLASGTLSVRRVAHELARYEVAHERNESTYWLWFELLWREYFHWYGIRHRQRLFAGTGVARSGLQSTFYPHRFRAWVEGNTEWPLVNACMNQLRETGWISNRARQIVASCFVNELELDWRFGAAWFQEQLVDYDVGSNWGNWQYLGGVGADPKGKRHFNLVKQQEQFDPDGEFVARWGGNSDNVTGLHTVDAADWPITPGRPIS
jgi:deoxyribodipyrimidine photo-lyase